MWCTFLCPWWWISTCTSLTSLDWSFNGTMTLGGPPVFDLIACNPSGCPSIDEVTLSIMSLDSVCPCNWCPTHLEKGLSRVNLLCCTFFDFEINFFFFLKVSFLLFIGVLLGKDCRCFGSPFCERVWIRVSDSLISRDRSLCSSRFRHYIVVCYWHGQLWSLTFQELLHALITSPNIYM